ncbi:MAG: AAA family ATPase, partial [Xanthomonadales bacterium]|nr:AAA family ATPase [Xanthomonadales bacterium]
MSTVYLQFFGLSEAPFAITPDPSFVYLSQAHRDALAHLLHGVGQGGSGGFVQLTGEVGTGKTTMCRCLLEQLPEKTQVALILNPLMTPREMLATICEELGIETGNIRDSSKGLVDALNAYLLNKHADGWRIVVVIDEAQNLSPEALEQVRLLTNLETAKHKLLQMVLLGQPELRNLLQRQDLRQLAQRITARYHIAPLGAEETAAYVKHRLEVAGAERNPFTRSALRALHQRSGGVPRLINIIADRSLAAGYAAEKPVIGPRLVHAAADEVQPGERQVRGNRWPWVVAGASSVALLALTVAMLEGPWSTADGAAAPVAGNSSRPPAAVTNESEGPIEADEGTRSAAAGNEPAPGVGAVIQPTDRSALALKASEVPEHESPALDPAWLAEQSALAWHGMARLWDDSVEDESIRRACLEQARTGFACLVDEGNWSRIQRLGLPVVLVLHLDQRRFLLLRGMQ